MRRPHRIASALPGLALFCLCAPLLAQQVPDAQQLTPAARDSITAAIRAAQAEMQRAAGQLDAAALYAHVLDTATPPIIEDGVVYADRATAFATTAAGLQRLGGITYRYTRQHITVLSPTLALWVGEGTTSATLLDGTNLAGPFADTILFALRANKWQVLHAHRSAPNPR